MKNILTILGFLLSISCIGQTNFNDLNEKGSMLTSDQLTIVNGAGTATYRATYETLFAITNDSLEAHLLTIQALRVSANTNTATTLSLQDSLHLIWEELFGETIIDNTAPELNSATVAANTPNIVTTNWTENLDSSQTAAIVAALSYSDGGSVTIDSVGITEFAQMFMYTDSIHADSSLSFSYTQPGSGGIQDSTGNRTASFTDYAITNNVVDSVLMDQVQYLFEQSTLSEVGSFHAAGVTNPVYESSSPSPAEGTYSAYFGSAGVSTWYVPSTYDLPDRFTIAFWFYKNVGSNPDYLVTNIYDDYNDGFKIGVDVPNDEILFLVEQGGWTVASTANSVFSDATWFHVAVSCIASTGDVTIYIDGVDQTDDGTVDSGYDLEGDDGKIRIGYTAYGNFDDFRIIGDTITEAEAAWIKNNPGDPFYRSGGYNPVQPSEFSEYADSIFAIDFDDEDVGTIYFDDMKRMFGDSYSQNNNFYANNAMSEIYDIGSGDMVFKSNNPAEAYALYSGNYNNGPYCGFQWFQDINLGNEVYISVNLYLPPGWVPEGTSELTEGGKLPIGAFGDIYPTAGIPYTDETGFWNIMMWKNDNLVNYLGYPDMSGIYNNHVGGRWPDPVSQDGSLYELTGGQWFNITQRYVLNDVGSYNGIIETFIDGVLVNSLTNLRLRLNSGVSIDGVVYSYFYGGGSDWAPAADQYIYFDDVYVFTYKSDQDVPRGHEASPPWRVLTLPANGK